MLHKEAAKILKSVENKEGSVKNLTLSSTYKVCVKVFFAVFKYCIFSLWEICLLLSRIIAFFSVVCIKCRGGTDYSN